MKTGQSKEDALTLSRIREISREANSLSTHLPDAGRCTKTQLGHIDSELLISRIRSSSGAIRETGHRGPAGENPFPSCAK